MGKSIFIKWLIIVIYISLLCWIWSIHIPVQNISLYFLIFTVSTCLMLIIFKLFPENGKTEG